MSELKVLISEDDDYKFEKVKRIILQLKEDAQIVRIGNVRDTIVCLRRNGADVLIQDMQLPMFSDSWDIKADGGWSVAYDVLYRGIDIPVKIICSSYIGLGEERKEDFNRTGFSFVYFDAMSSERIKNDFERVFAELDL